MPDRVDDTLNAIGQQWLGGASLYAPTYIKLLRSKLGLVKRSALDSALSLGSRPDSDPEVTKQRHAVRAYMLASYLIKGVPLKDRDRLKAEVINKTLAEVVSRFKALFPATMDFNNRILWDNNLFTDPNTMHVLKTNRTNWGGVAIPDYKFITHSFLVGSEGNLYADTEGTLSGWDAISTAVISKAKPQSYGTYGVILKVPKANILTTSSADQQFQNHIGTTHGRTAAEKTGGIGNKGLLAKHIVEKGLEYGGLQSPAEVIRNQGTDPTGMGLTVTKHNEVVVIGRPGLSWAGGTTTRIQLAAFFLKVGYDGKIFSNRTVATPTQTEVTKLKNAAQAKNVPLLFIPDNTGTNQGGTFT